MQENAQKQPQVRILPSLRVDQRQRLREADIDEVVKTVKSVVSDHVNGNIDATITLLEKNLKIIEDTALMQDALAELVRDAMNAMSGYGQFSLTIDQVNFQVESLLRVDTPIIGACDFISLAGVSTNFRVDAKIREKIFEPFFSTKASRNGLGLAVAYRIIKRHYDERIKVESRMGRGAEVNIYLPLTRMEIVNMMSIPAG